MNHLLHINIPESDLQRLSDAAKAKGVTLPVWIRNKLGIKTFDIKPCTVCGAKMKCGLQGNRRIDSMFCSPKCRQQDLRNRRKIAQSL